MSTNEPAATERPGLPEIPKSLQPIALVVGVAALMWGVEVVNTIDDGHLDRWGIQPRTVHGLIGIVFAPFLHTGFAHLIGNTVPFVVLGAIIALSGIRRFVQVTIIVGLASGAGVWVIGYAHTYTVGASGLVFGYLTYLVARGFFERNLLYLIAGLIVAFAYGTILWGAIPGPVGVSWQGHLFGALGGVLAAKLLHSAREPGDAVIPTTGKPVLDA